MQLDKTLARHPAVEVTLVNQDNFFLFTPMLHEVAASDLDITHIVNPVHKLLRRVQFFAGEVDHIDLSAKRVVVGHGLHRHTHELDYDYLVIGLGAVTNFYNLPGLQEHTLTMKSLGDALRIRNRLIALLEEANSECAAPLHQQLLTFVVRVAALPASKPSPGSTTSCRRPGTSTRISGLSLCVWFWCIQER